MAQITKEDRLRRALFHLEREKKREELAMKEMERIHLNELIIVRNEKRMYIARIDQVIRNIKTELAEGRLAEDIAAEVGS